LLADEILLKKAQDGDKAAYGELVRRYQDRIYGLAARMLDTPEDARDAAQEVFVKAYRALSGFDFRAGFATWLYRIATNTCLDLLRRRNRERRRSISLEAGTGGADLLRHDGPGPEEVWLKREKELSLRRAVRELPMVLFFGAIFVAGMAGLDLILTLVLPVVFFYNIFDTLQLAGRMREGVPVEDKPFIDLQGECNKTNLLGYVLVGLGILALLNNFLPHLFGYSFYSFMRQVFTPLLIISLGVFILYRNLKRGKEDGSQGD